MSYHDMLAGAQEVVARRTLRMALGQMTAPEAAEMVTEKMVAWSAASVFAALALSRGADPFAAALAPIADAVAKNVAALLALTRGDDRG